MMRANRPSHRNHGHSLSNAEINNRRGSNTSHPAQVPDSAIIAGSLNSIPGFAPGLPSPLRTLFVLHPAFALTGILHAAAGPLLPSLAASLSLSDSRLGLLLSLYFGGTSLGALLCIRNYTRTLALGFCAAALTCGGVAFSPRTLLYPLFFTLGISVGASMTAVSMIAGRTFAQRSAAPLTLLNFSWSLGALLAPVFAARLLVHHSYRTAYLLLAIFDVLAAIACGFGVQETPELARHSNRNRSFSELRLVVLFALLTFLEVGIENTTASWLATFVLRTAEVAPARAAAASSFYWIGFLTARGVAAVVLVRVRPIRVLTGAVLAALVASLILIAIPGAMAARFAMIALGAALAPIFPLLLASFFARAAQSSSSRWVLAFCGFGGSVIPWLTGYISARAGSLRIGLSTIPAALLLIASLLPVLRARRTESV